MKAGTFLFYAMATYLLGSIAWSVLPPLVGVFGEAPRAPGPWTPHGLIPLLQYGGSLLFFALSLVSIARDRRR